MPVSFLGSCEPDYELHIADLILGPFEVGEMAQFEGHCEADVLPLELYGWWEAAGWVGEPGAPQLYQVTIEVPEPELTLGLIAGLLLLLAISRYRPHQ